MHSTILDVRDKKAQSQCKLLQECALLSGVRVSSSGGKLFICEKDLIECDMARACGRGAVSESRVVT